MNTEFISYAEAVALKELGFDDECLAIYTSYSTAMQKYYKNPALLVVRQKSQFTQKTAIKAPLYQQAFRWFREKHDLGHMINGIGHESFIMNIAGLLHIFNAFDFETYEEAELACLQKLIEIVKNK